MAPKKEKAPPPSSKPAKSGGGKQKKKNSTTSNSNALLGGIAYGGYARKIVGRVLSGMQSESGEIESSPDHLPMAVIQAMTLVGGVKSYNITCS